MRETEFMLDTGAEPNLIKVSKVKEGTAINAKDRLTLQGITEGRVETHGSTQVRISGKSVEFYVVPDSFPITTEGLLGTSFCSSGATISYPEQRIVWGDIIILFSNNAVTIPARSVTYIPLRSTGPPIAFLSQRQLVPDVTIPNALVQCEGGQLFTQCVNTASEPRVVTAPIIELEEVELISFNAATPSSSQSLRHDRTNSYRKQQDRCRSNPRIKQYNPRGASK